MMRLKNVNMIDHHEPYQLANFGHDNHEPTQNGNLGLNNQVEEFSRKITTTTRPLNPTVT